MVEALPENGALERIFELAKTRTLVAIGPGLGTAPETRQMVQRLFADLDKPMVVDADALNCIADTDWHGGKSLRVLTPHPGEMGRLVKRKIAEIQADRIGVARDLAAARGVTLVLPHALRGTAQQAFRLLTGAGSPCWQRRRGQ